MATQPGSPRESARKRVLALRGVVTVDRFAPATKSAHDAVFLQTRAKRYVLRRRDGPAFDDAQLRELVGCNVECDGIVVAYVLIADDIRIV